MSTEAPAVKGIGRWVSVLEGVRPYRREWLSKDIVAGITLAALAIPETMGYTKIAGMPVITGLYTILIPIMAFAVFGSSRHLVVGRGLRDRGDHVRRHRRPGDKRGDTRLADVGRDSRACPPSSRAP